MQRADGRTVVYATALPPYRLPPDRPTTRLPAYTLTSDNTIGMLSNDKVSRSPMSDPRSDLLQGTLDLLILKTLTLEPLHGWGIAKRIQQLSAEVLRVGQGSLYPALYRLEDRGWIKAAWGISPEGRKAKFYQLTPAGRRQLVAETEGWRLFSGAMNQVLQAT